MGKSRIIKIIAIAVSAAVTAVVTEMMDHREMEMQIKEILDIAAKQTTKPEV